jgi:hypothetical protein
VPLQAFMANFCAPTQDVPMIAGAVFRQTMNQPGPYWLLDAPFVQILGLCSNAAENPGFITGDIPGPEQKDWLVRTLKDIAAQRAKGQQKALIITTHHPPFTAGVHSPSPEMLADIDDACAQAGVMPDMFLSGHTHAYQRHQRTVTFAGRRMEIPYIVAGSGGRSTYPVFPASGQQQDGHVYMRSREGFGYLLLSVDAKSICMTMVGVEATMRYVFDSITVDLATSTIREGQTGMPGDEGPPEAPGPGGPAEMLSPGGRAEMLSRRGPARTDPPEEQADAANDEGKAAPAKAPAGRPRKA